MSDQDLSGLGKFAYHLQQIDVVRFVSVGGKDRHGVPAGKYQGIVFSAASFEGVDRSIYRQGNAGVGFDVFRRRNSEYLVRDVVFIKVFQVLKQAAPVDGIHGQDSYFFCHVFFFDG